MGESNSKDTVSRSGGLKKWVRIKFSHFTGQIVGALLTTGALSLTYMIFNDYISPPPDLSGSWKFTVRYEDTTLPRYVGMQVTYQVLLIQEGLNLAGSGEKLSERGPNIDGRDYRGDTRSNIQISGTIKRNFFSSDQLTLHYNEMGSRPSSTVHQMVQCSEGEMLCGCFRSTIADTTGSVWWQHRGSLENIFDPVTQPTDCQDSACINSTSACL